MRKLILGLGLGLLLAAVPSPPPPTDCGDTPAELPDFTLEDVNLNSPTGGDSVSLASLLSQHLVIYWAQAT